MKNTGKVFLIMVFWYIFAGIESPFCLAQQVKQPSISPKISSVRNPVKPTVTLPDYPQIREFSLTPHDWLMTETGNVIFNWRVDPGVAGTPLRGIAIAKQSGDGPPIEHTSTDGTGRCVLNISSSPFIPEGKTTYRLTATNEKGTTNTKTAEFLVKSMSVVRDEISMASLVTEPAEISEGVPFIFVLRLNNHSDVKVPNVTMPARTGKGYIAYGTPIASGFEKTTPESRGIGGPDSCSRDKRIQNQVQSGHACGISE